MRSKDAAVVRFLIDHKGEELNIRMISRAMKMDYKNAYSIVKRLEKLLLVKIERFGQSSRVILNAQVHPLVVEAELERRKEVLRDRNLAVALSSFKNALKSGLYALLLFGSHAKKTQTKSSDIDLMFICADGLEEYFERVVESVTRSIPLPLHPLVFSESQFKDMLNAKEPNVGKEALKNSVILYGIEQYYGMV